MSHAFICRRGDSGGSGRGTPVFTYTGSYELVNDLDVEVQQGDKTLPNWKLRLLTSGMLLFTSLGSAKNLGVDAFLVGGGGNGNIGGGGSGYTHTEPDIPLQTGIQYTIIVGEATGSSTFLTYSAAGGESGAASQSYGGNGGSGGSYGPNNVAADNYGGADGGNGYMADATHGKGQGTTTREFGEAEATLYAGGGGGYRSGSGGAGGGGNAGAYSNRGADGQANTGGGGGGGISPYSAGGSGIVIIRNHREAIA